MPLNKIDAATMVKINTLKRSYKVAQKELENARFCKDTLMDVYYEYLLSSYSKRIQGYINGGYEQ